MKAARQMSRRAAQANEKRGRARGRAILKAHVRLAQILEAVGRLPDGERERVEALVARRDVVSAMITRARVRVQKIVKRRGRPMSPRQIEALLTDDERRTIALEKRLRGELEAAVAHLMPDAPLAPAASDAADALRVLAAEGDPDAAQAAQEAPQAAPPAEG